MTCCNSCFLSCKWDFGSVQGWGGSCQLWRRLCVGRESRREGAETGRGDLQGLGVCKALQTRHQFCRKEHLLLCMAPHKVCPASLEDRCPLKSGISGWKRGCPQLHLGSWVLAPSLGSPGLLAWGEFWQKGIKKHCLGWSGCGGLSVVASHELVSYCLVIYTQLMFLMLQNCSKYANTCVVCSEILLWVSGWHLLKLVVNKYLTYMKANKTMFSVLSSLKWIMWILIVNKLQKNDSSVSHSEANDTGRTVFPCIH